MSGGTFLARLLAARERWVRLDEQREVRIRRPAESRMPALLLRGELEDYAACVVDWRGPGFTEAALLGPALASDTPVPFSTDVWLALATDNVAWVKTISAAIKADVEAFMEKRGAAEKN